jgi:hypothetical protein
LFYYKSLDKIVPVFNVVSFFEGTSWNGVMLIFLWILELSTKWNAVVKFTTILLYSKWKCSPASVEQKVVWASDKFRKLGTREKSISARNSLISWSSSLQTHRITNYSIRDTQKIYYYSGPYSGGVWTHMLCFWYYPYPCVDSVYLFVRNIRQTQQLL